MAQLSAKVEKALREVLAKRAEALALIAQACENIAVAAHIRKNDDGTCDVVDGDVLVQRFADFAPAEEFVRDAWQKSFSKPELERPRGKAPETDPSLDTEPGFRGRDGRKGARLDGVTYPPVKKRTRIL